LGFEKLENKKCMVLYNKRIMMQKQTITVCFCFFIVPAYACAFEGAIKKQ